MGDLRYNQLEKVAVTIIAKTQSLGSMTAGTTYEKFLPSAPVLDANHDGVGGFGNSSASFNNSVLLTEVPTVDKIVNSGDYFVNYKTGYIKVKAGASATPTATYYVKQLEIVGTFTAEVTVGDIEVTSTVASPEYSIIAEGEVTVVTAGTPVPLPSNTSAKVVIVMNNNTGVKVVVGKSATVDAMSTPPVGRTLFAYDAFRVGVASNSNEVYVDADTSSTKVSYHILG